MNNDMLLSDVLNYTHNTLYRKILDHLVDDDMDFKSAVEDAIALRDGEIKWGSLYCLPMALFNEYNRDEDPLHIAWCAANSSHFDSHDEYWRMEYDGIFTSYKTEDDVIDHYRLHISSNDLMTEIDKDCRNNNGRTFLDGLYSGDFRQLITSYCQFLKFEQSMKRGN